MFGTLCAIDSKPANFSLEDQRQLEKYAALFSYVVELEKESLKKKEIYEIGERQRKINQEIMDNVNEGILFVDVDGVLIHANEKLRNFFTIDDTQLETLSFQEWIPLFLEKAANREELYRFLKGSIKLRNKANFQYELNFPISKRMEVYSQTIFRNETEIGTLFVFRDITAEYEVDKMKSELVSTVSHELRTPLASVLGFTELLLTKELKPEREKKYIQTIHKEAQRLTKLINDFLDLQRMEAGELSYEMEPINMESIIVQVTDSFRLENSSFQFTVKNFSRKPWIRGDEGKLIQVFTNLVGNAIKFSPNGGNITISINANNGRLIVHVGDEGLGIPENALPLLFKKFQRIDNSDRRKIGGTGLGLAITKEIVEGLGGDITVRSEMGKGSVFTLHFPLIEEENSDVLLADLGDLPKIFILEDDYSLGSLLKDELEDVGFSVLHFTNGDQFLEKVNEYPPVGIVIDLIIDGHSIGWDVVEQLKGDKRTESIPIFISSALEEQDRGEELKVSNYLLKPYSPRKLSTVILQTLLLGSKGEILYPLE